MGPESNFSILLLSFAALFFSGVLSGIKTVLGFLQKQNSEHGLNANNDRIALLIDDAKKIWTKPGFFESLSLGRFVLDTLAVLCANHFIHQLFPITPFWLITLFTILFCYATSHWFFPLLAQAYALRLAEGSIQAYRVYSFLLMGRIGEILFSAHDYCLNKMGYDHRLSFLVETKLNSTAEDEHPDRSGLQEDEKEMIRSIFDLRETQAKEIMTPRVDVVGLEMGVSYATVIELITREKFSRIPVYKDTMDSVQGILHVMDMMGLKENEKQESFDLGHYLREAYFVPRTKKIGDLMSEFRKKHIHMAIVVDEYGGTAGIVTLEDVLEEIVGEIHDEDEVETTRIKKLEEGIFLVDPIISLSDLHEELEIELKPEDDDIQIDTLGGFILFLHGKVPEKGDVVRYKEITFEIIEMDGQKMEKIRMTVNTLVNS